MSNCSSSLVEERWIKEPCKSSAGISWKRSCFSLESLYHHQAKQDPSLYIFVAVFLAFASFFLHRVVIRTPRMATKMKGIYKSFKYISQIFDFEQQMGQQPASELFKDILPTDLPKIPKKQKRKKKSSNNSPKSSSSSSRSSRAAKTKATYSEMEKSNIQIPIAVQSSVKMGVNMLPRVQDAEFLSCNLERVFSSL
ncbi:hypothetical protein WN944_012089 [Citrus x changshan-huyou]|uniref:Uncharacterized protein n=1 Tax=Citrus x changshan-huyou TaxID=2935761 RepID=A0AAP0MUK4_9ROSI